MNHLTMEQMLAIREPGLEPGVQGWRDHAEQCEVCQAELMQLDQRIARLRALPVLRPARSRLPEIQALTRRSRFRRRLAAFSLSGLALAATIALVVFIPRGLGSGGSEPTVAQRELDEMIARSRALENVIQALDPDRRVTDGRTALMAATLEDQVARLDQQLQVLNLMDGRSRPDEALQLWRERVGLLDALVDVHATGARFVRY